MKPVPQILAPIIIVFSLLCFSGSAAEAQRRPPNILVIVTDDMGYADIGIHGSKDIPTPNIDALAKGGIRFIRNGSAMNSTLILLQPTVISACLSAKPQWQIV